MPKYIRTKPRGPRFKTAVDLRTMAALSVVSQQLNLNLKQSNLDKAQLFEAYHSLNEDQFNILSIILERISDAKDQGEERVHFNNNSDDEADVPFDMNIITILNARGYDVLDNTSSNYFGVHWDAEVTDEEAAAGGPHLVLHRRCAI